MTYYVTALTNDKARLVAKELRVTCKDTAKSVAAAWMRKGYVVFQNEQG